MAPPDKGGTEKYLKHLRKILCQALETQGKDNQKNWLSLCVFFIYPHNYETLVANLFPVISRKERKYVLRYQRKWKENKGT